MKKHFGFTLIEMVVTIALLGVIASVSVSRFANVNEFSKNGSFDQIKYLLKLGQQTAVAQKRTVYSIFASNLLLLCYQNSSPCPVNQRVTVGNKDFSISVNSSDLTLPAFSFNQKGNTGTGKLTISAYSRNLYIEEDTGYIHE